MSQRRFGGQKIPRRDKTLIPRYLTDKRKKSLGIIAITLVSATSGIGLSVQLLSLQLIGLFLTDFGPGIFSFVIAGLTTATLYAVTLAARLFREQTKASRQSWLLWPSLVVVLVIFLQFIVMVPLKQAVSRWFLAEPLDKPPSEGVAFSRALFDATEGVNAIQILIVGLDSPVESLAPRPDSLTLVTFTPEDNVLTLQPILRDWTYSILAPTQTLAEKHVGIQDCAPYCRLMDLTVRASLEDQRLEFLLPVSAPSTVAAGIIANELEVRQLFVIEFSMDQLVEIVDALGGVTVEISDALPIGGDWTQDGLVNPRGYLEPGVRSLNGQEAKWFARARWGSSNESRVSRQQQLISALLEQKPLISVMAVATQITGSSSTIPVDLFSAQLLNSDFGGLNLTVLPALPTN